MRNLYLILILISSLAQAQVMQWSSPIKLKGAAVYTKVMGENQDGVFVLRYRTRLFSSKTLIDRYSHHLTLEESAAIDLKKARLVKIKMTQKGILIFKARFNRKTQDNELVAHYMDYQLKPIGEEKIILSSVLQEFGDRGDFRVRVSDDEQRIAVMHTQKEGAKMTRVFWTILNANLETVTSVDKRMPIAKKNFMLMNYLVTDSGYTYALIKEKLEITRKGPKFINRLLLQEKDSVSYTEFKDSLVYRNADITYDRHKQELVFACFYGRPDNYGSDGTFVYRYNTLSAEESYTRTAFSDEMAKDLNVSKSGSTTIPEGFEFLKLIPRSDGGLLLVAEQKEIDTENDIVMLHGIPTSTSKNIYNFNDIALLNLDSTGALDWHHVIHKNQTTINDGGYFSSAVVYIHNDFIQLIYNDQIRNSGEVMQYTVYSNGKVMTRKLLKSEIDYVVVVPVEATQVSSNKLIIPTSKNRRFALLKLIYD